MANNILPEIEKNFALDKLVSKEDQTPIWPLLRQRVYFSHLRKTVGYDPKKRTRKIGPLLKNFFYGFSKLFSVFGYEHYCFENTNKRVLYQGKWFDIYFDAWADKLGKDESLFVEFAAQKYHPRSKVHSKNIVSDLPFKLMAWWFAKRTDPQLQDPTILDQIKDKYQLTINTQREIKRQLGEYRFYRWFFKRCKKVKTVFVLSSFSKVPLVMAAKSLKIPVVEAQHGYIGLGHPFYSTNFKFEQAYPDVLLSFGTYEKAHAERIVFKADQIFPTGSLHLQLEKNKPIPAELQELRSKYDYIVCLTMQDMKEEELLGMTKPLADSDANVLFVICPKNRSLDYSKYTEHPKYVVSRHPIYDVLKISDINITLFSTTAVEGEFLGARTVFYNAGGFSKSYFDTDSLGNLVLEETEFLSLAHITQAKPSSTSYFVGNYFENVADLELMKLIDQQ